MRFGARCDRVLKIEDELITREGYRFKARYRIAVEKYEKFHGFLKKLPNCCPKFSLASSYEVSIHDITSRVSRIPTEYRSTDKEEYWVVA